MYRIPECKIAYEEYKQKQNKSFFMRIDPRRMKQMQLCMKDKTYDPLGIENKGISRIFNTIKTNNMEELYKYLVYGCPLTVKDDKRIFKII